MLLEIIVMLNVSPIGSVLLILFPFPIYRFFEMVSFRFFEKSVMEAASVFFFYLLYGFAEHFDYLALLALV